MSHTKEIHFSNVNLLCRICGYLTQSKKDRKRSVKPCLVDKLSKELKFLFGYNLAASESISKYVCYKCSSSIKKCVSRASVEAKKTITCLLQRSEELWVPFDHDKSEDDCAVCKRKNELKCGINLISRSKVIEETKVLKATTYERKTESKSNTEQFKQQIENKGGGQNNATCENSSVQSQCCSYNVSDHGSPSPDAGEGTSHSSLPATCPPSGTQLTPATTLTAPPVPAPPASPARSLSDDDEFLSMAYNEFQGEIDYAVSGHDIDNDNSRLISIETQTSFSDFDTSFDAANDKSKDKKRQVHASTPRKSQTTGTDCVTPVKISPIKKSAFTSPKDKHFETIQESLNKSLSEPLNSAETVLMTKFAKRVIKDNRRKKLSPNILKLKTGGKPLTFVRTIVSRKNPLSLGRTCRKRKIKLINQFRELGGCKLETELSIITKKRRDQVVRNSLLGKRVRMDRKAALALRESLGLSIRKARLLQSSLRDLGVVIEGEKKQLDLAKDIVKDVVSVQEKTFRNESLSETPTAPFAKIADLPKFLDQHLDKLNDKGLLTWCDGMDKDTINIKIGADHGKNSFKFTMGVINTPKANSQNNTIVIGMAAVEDTYENLDEFLKGGVTKKTGGIVTGILDDLKALQNHSWRGKKIKLSLNGDYDFLCKAYGISGAAGKFPCIWCLIPSESLVEKHKTFEARTVQSIINDHNRFSEETKKDRSKVKLYNNALHYPLLPIELEDICPPYLHILLGVVWRHHVLLKKEIYLLENLLINQAKRTCTEEGLLFKEYGSSFMNKGILEEQLRVIETFLIYSESDNQSTTYQDLHDKTEDDLAALTFKKLEANKGPISKSTDKLLTDHRITPQSYHGGAFIGNHCHNYIAKQVYKLITQNIIVQVSKYTYDTSITDKAHLVKSMFDEINEKFYKVHKAISHTRKVPANTLDGIQTDIDNYIIAYLNHFPGKKLLPKQHILHRHCVPYIKRHGFGLGLAGEQSTESSHQTIARIERRSACILNAFDRLQFIMNSHILGTSPLLFCNKPKKTRKRKLKQ